MRFPLSPLSPSFHLNSSSSGNTLTKSQKRPTHTSFLPFEIPSRVAEAFDFPHYPTQGKSNGGTIESMETIVSYDKEESFSPFGERTGKVGMGFGLGFGFRTKSKSKKEKRGTLTGSPNSASASVSASLHAVEYSHTPSSRTITPARSIDSISSVLSSPISVKPRVIPRVRPPRVDLEPNVPLHSTTTPPHYSYTPSLTSRHAHPPPPPISHPKTIRQSPTSNNREIEELEKLSYHFLAENKIPGYHSTIHPGSEDAYERTRAMPRSRKPSITSGVNSSVSLAGGGELEGYVLVTRPDGGKGKSALGHAKGRGRAQSQGQGQGQGYIKTSDRQSLDESAASGKKDEIAQSGSFRGWRRLRPTSGTSAGGGIGGGKGERPVSEGVGGGGRLVRKAATATALGLGLGVGVGESGQEVMEGEYPASFARALTSTSRPGTAPGSTDGGEGADWKDGVLRRGITRMRSISSTRLVTPQPQYPPRLPHTSPAETLLPLSTSHSFPPAPHSRTDHARSKPSLQTLSGSSSYPPPNRNLRPPHDHPETLSTASTAPPIPPRAPSRPPSAPISRQTSSHSISTLPLQPIPNSGNEGYSYSYVVPLVLSSRDGGEVKNGLPRGAVRDSMNSRTGTEVSLTSPRQTPIQLTPLPPISALPPLPPLLPTQPIPPPLPARKSLIASTSTSRFSKLRIKRSIPESLTINSSPRTTTTLASEVTNRSRASTGPSVGAVTRTSTVSGDGDSIVEEGMRVLDEFRRVEKIGLGLGVGRGRENDSGGSFVEKGKGRKSVLEARDEPRFVPVRVRSSEDGQEGGGRWGVVNAEDASGTRRSEAKRNALGGMTALSFLAMDLEDMGSDALGGQGGGEHVDKSDIVEVMEAMERHSSTLPRLSSSDENHTTAGITLTRVQPQSYYPHHLSAGSRSYPLPHAQPQSHSQHMPTSHYPPGQSQTPYSHPHSHPQPYPQSQPQIQSHYRQLSTESYPAQAENGIMAITHIIPPEERSRIGGGGGSSRSGHGSRTRLSFAKGSISSLDNMDAPHSPRSPHTPGSASRPNRRSQLIEFHNLHHPSGQKLSPHSGQGKYPTSPYSPQSFYSNQRYDGMAPTALSPPPRSRKMTGRAGSAPGPGGMGPTHGTGQAASLFGVREQSLGPDVFRGQGSGGSRSLSMGAIAAPSASGSVKDDIDPESAERIASYHYPQPRYSTAYPHPSRSMEDEDGVEPLFTSSSSKVYRPRIRRVSGLGSRESVVGEYGEESLELVLLGEFGEGGGDVGVGF